MNIAVTPGRKILGRLAKGEDLLAALEKVAREHGIILGEVQAIGAVSQARVGFYNQAERKYYFLDLARPLEIASLIGNISVKDEKPMVHAHVTLSDHDWPGLRGAFGRRHPGLCLRICHPGIPVRHADGAPDG